MGIRIAVLASGRGSNLVAIMQAIAEKKIDGEIAVVLSDKAEAKALEHAKNAGIPAYHVNPKAYEQKADYEAELLRYIEQADCQLICLAGYMRILSPYFVSQATCPIMNIHPALLPAFPGLHGQRQALEYGVKVAGCTVHFVDEGMDSGAIILQKTVPVLHDDTEDSLSARILEQEHQAYPEAIQLFAQGKLELCGRIVKVKGE
ncbi:MAG: phosphoribosylglycinamide formyltransferase [Peptococcaceae bacterium]